MHCHFTFVFHKHVLVFLYILINMFTHSCFSSLDKHVYDLICCQHKKVKCNILEVLMYHYVVCIFDSNVVLYNYFS